LVVERCEGEGQERLATEEAEPLQATRGHRGGDAVACDERASREQAAERDDRGRGAERGERQGDGEVGAVEAADEQGGCSCE
jgi:hypothetical protein